MPPPGIFTTTANVAALPSPEPKAQPLHMHTRPCCSPTSGNLCSPSSFFSRCLPRSKKAVWWTSGCLAATVLLIVILVAVLTQHKGGEGRTTSAAQQKDNQQQQQQQQQRQKQQRSRGEHIPPPPFEDDEPFQYIGPQRPARRSVAQAFVQVNDRLQFERECEGLFLVGLNANDLTEVAQVTPASYSTHDGVTGKQVIRTAMGQAADLGLNAVRAWAHSSDPQFPFQVAAGVYLETAFRGLDFVLHQASLHDLHVILSFIDNWKYYNGIDQFVDWSRTAPTRTQDRPQDNAGDPQPIRGLDLAVNQTATTAAGNPAYEAARHALFFTDPGSRALYRNHVKTVLQRVNVYNGRTYSEDPTILAWDLANEPRCEVSVQPKCGDMLQTWVEEMAAFVKSLDANHMVTIGSEGFFGPTTPNLLEYNPGSWASAMGQDFVRNNALANIDFATMHIWPDNWGSSLAYEEFVASWLASHVEAAERLLGKPVLLEEFGKSIPGLETNATTVAEQRDPVYNQTYAQVENLVLRQTLSAVQDPSTTFEQKSSGRSSSLSITSLTDAVQQLTVPQAPELETVYTLNGTRNVSSTVVKRLPIRGPLVGTLFWKWQLQVFTNGIPDDYGVQVTDTTLDVVQQHVYFVEYHTASTTARTKVCSMDCWVATTPPPMQHMEGGGGLYNTSTMSGGQQLRHFACASQPAACGMTWGLTGSNSSAISGGDQPPITAQSFIEISSRGNSSGSSGDSPDPDIDLAATPIALSGYYPVQGPPDFSQLLDSASKPNNDVSTTQLQVWPGGLDSREVVADPVSACMHLRANLNATSILANASGTPLLLSLNVTGPAPGIGTAADATATLLRLSCNVDGSSFLTTILPAGNDSAVGQLRLYSAVQRIGPRVFVSEAACCAPGSGAYVLGCGDF